MSDVLPPLDDLLADAALAFKGYDETNLGRSPELLDHAKFGPTVELVLHEASQICAETIGRPVDLVAQVRQRKETPFACYAEAVTLIVAMEIAQLRLLKEFFQIDYRRARLAYGFSLGEIAAVVAGGLFELRDALRIPLMLAQDCVELAEGVTLGILFCREQELPLDDIRRMCVVLNMENRGVIGISAYLTPNSVLLMGQGDTLDRFAEQMRASLPQGTKLKKHGGHWPPLHTPLMWQRFVPDRACLLMYTMPGGLTNPVPPILSLVTGEVSYNNYNARDILCHWTDHPQLLWNAIDETLASGIETVVHVGPAPNIIPSTFTRLARNVEAYTRGHLGMQALSVVVRRPWLAALLPRRASLLRAPLLRHVILEDWLLLDNPP